RPNALDERFEVISANIEAQVERIDAVNAELGEELGVSERWATLREEWLTLKARSRGMTPDETSAAHQTIIKETMALITVVGNNSNLILDPNINSYYLMDNLSSNLPMTTDYLSQIRTLGLLVATRSRET